jgi:two-component system response regulator AlgR
MNALRILIVDDEAPARARLQDLLGDLAATRPLELVGSVASGQQALEIASAQPVDVVLVDVRMPVMDGVELAQRLKQLPAPPRVVFVTAYDEYAVQAFDLSAVDYLMKPVRAARLAAALDKAAPQADSVTPAPTPHRTHLIATARGALQRIPIEHIVYLEADSKYVVAHTADAEYLLDESLSHLEQEFAARFVRIHRGCLVARGAIAAVESAPGQDESTEGRVVKLRGIRQPLAVSRRQWPALKRTLNF